MAYIRFYLKLKWYKNIIMNADFVGKSAIRFKSTKR